MKFEGGFVVEDGKFVFAGGYDFAGEGDEVSGGVGGEVEEDVAHFGFGGGGCGGGWCRSCGRRGSLRWRLSWRLLLLGLLRGVGVRAGGECECQRQGWK